MLVLEARGLCKRYGTVAALQGAELLVEAGEVHGLIGPNGSGKSTLLHVVAGRTPADQGRVDLDGRAVTRDRPSARARKGMSIKFQFARVYRERTVAENLLLAAQVRSPLLTLVRSGSRRSLAGQVSQALDDFGLGGVRDAPAGQLSHGEQQWLEIAMAMATGPKVLLLDEPTGGMSPQERARTGELIRAAAQRCAVVMVEHDLDFVRTLCDRITVLHQGANVATGTPEEIEQDPRVAEVYLTRA